MRVAIYARVSTIDQDCSLQVAELRSYCAARGWQVSMSLSILFPVQSPHDLVATSR